MSSSNAKDIRKQVRNVCQEILGDTLSNELIQALEKRLNDRLQAHMIMIESNVREALQRIDARSKDIQDFILRNVAAPAKVEEGQQNVG